MLKLQDLYVARKEASDAADAILSRAEQAKRQLTAQESALVDEQTAQLKSLNAQITQVEGFNTIRRMVDANGRILTDGPRQPSAPLGQASTHMAPAILSPDYFTDFHNWIGSRGQKVGAALYEGSGPAGGFTVPVMVQDQVVPLAPTEMGVRTIANIIPTAMDIKIPRGTAFGTADLKAESGGSDNFFVESDPTMDQFTLSAFMAGAVRTISWELAQDVPTFQEFCVRDLTLALQTKEESLYCGGTGTGQAQGLIGNTGAGVTGVVAGSDNYASELLDASFDVQSTLNAAYYGNACWLMSRATGVSIRKAQKQANLFAPVWTRENGRDYLHGFPVVFSGYMPAIAAGATPVLFGDFREGYVIGDRGGSGINVKILDQPKATEGQLVLLAYRRTDGRVRRSEAIQAITLAS